MSTIVSIKNDNSYQVVDRGFTSPRDDQWALVGKALGYPDSWVAIIRQRLAKDGKAWSWKMTDSASTVLEESPRADSPALKEEGHVLLIITRHTTTSAIRDALLLAQGKNADLTVVYTSRPPLIDDSNTTGEVDQKFTWELQNGRSFLDSIRNEARNLGIKIETSFIWAESSSDLIAQHDFHADLVINETA